MRRRAIKLRRRNPQAVLLDAALRAQETLLEMAPRLHSSDPLYRMVVSAAMGLAVALEFAPKPKP